jgi:hypothetical protein
LGTTATKGMLCDKELNASLLDKLYCELNYRIGLEAIDEEIDEPEFDGGGFSIRDRYPHYVTNEEADEDAKQNDRFNGVSQFILDFVEANNVVTFAEMNDMYKAYTKGSNSLSHIIKALMIPYKNRPTRRYLNKVKHGVYEVKLANPSNWVVNDYDYRTFNEAPYGND